MIEQILIAIRQKLEEYLENEQVITAIMAELTEVVDKLIRDTYADLCDDMDSEGYERGYDDGYEKGKRDGRKEAERDTASRISNLPSIPHEVRRYIRNQTGVM